MLFTSVFYFLLGVLTASGLWRYSAGLAIVASGALGSDRAKLLNVNLLVGVDDPCGSGFILRFLGDGLLLGIFNFVVAAWLRVELGVRGELRHEGVL